MDTQSIMTAGFCLEYLKNRNIGYCWNRGGLPSLDYSKFYMTDPLLDHLDKEIPLNLWKYSAGDDPMFHVKDDSIQESFANMCLNHILDSLDV